MRNRVYVDLNARDSSVGYHLPRVPQGRTPQLATECTPEMMQEVKDAAADNDMSVSSFLRYVLRCYLD